MLKVGDYITVYGWAHGSVDFWLCRVDVAGTNTFRARTIDGGEPLIQHYDKEGTRWVRSWNEFEIIPLRALIALENSR